jgi:hypothetical protein
MGILRMTKTLVKAPQYNTGVGEEIARRKAQQAAAARRLRKKIIRARVKESKLEFRCERSVQAASRTLARLSDLDRVTLTKAANEFPALGHTLEGVLAQQGHVLMVVRAETRFYADGHQYTLPKTLRLQDPKTLDVFADVPWRRR